MAGAQPEEAVPVPVVHQGWRHVAFVHWRYEPEVIASRLPPGLEVDTYDGEAWVSLTPFLVCGFRPALLPAVPGLSSFPETNLRTYVRDRTGRDGLWFLSLDVDSALTTMGARLGYGVPYHWASMAVEQPAQQTFTYRSQRRWGHAGHDITVRAGAPLTDAKDLDHWLTGRWRAFTCHAGRLLDVAVRHQPWPLHAATVEHLDESVRAAARLPATVPEPLVHFAPAVDAHLGPPRPSPR